MKKYYATQDIGDYNEGDEVPENKALIWADMYALSPVRVEIVEDKIIPKKEVNDLDLNHDGKVDSKDAKIASKVLNAVKASKGREN